MSRDHVKIRRALLSVSDKTGLIELATALDLKGVELLQPVGLLNQYVMQVYLLKMYRI